MNKSVFFLILIAIALNCSTQFSETDMDREANVTAILLKLTENKKTPSVQYLIFDSERIIYSFSGGLADIAENRIADHKTTYHGYSVTKTFTALAILQLAADGKLDIDNPVNLYLPDFPYGSHITVRHLLSHSSGIPNPIPLSWIHPAEEHESFDHREFYDREISDNRKVHFGPNEKFAYSNIGYMILGQLIEQVSGMPYEKFVEDNIFKQLAPDELAFQIPDHAHHADHADHTVYSDHAVHTVHTVHTVHAVHAVHAKGYHKHWSISNAMLGIFIDKNMYMDDAIGGWKPFRPLYVNGPSYGGIIGTPSGFMAYIREFLKDDSELIPDPMKKLMFTQNILAGGKASDMTLSWFTGELNGVRYYTHAGGGGGYYVELRMYPDAGIGSVIMFNRSGMSDERFLDKTDRFFITHSYN